MMSPHTSAAAWLRLLIMGFTSGAASAQESPVYVNDSPQAWQQFRLARDHAKDNPGEAVRILQELLDEDGAKLMPVRDTSSGQFVCVRERVLDALRDPRLLGRYQLIEQAEAERLLQSGRLDRAALTRSLTAAGLDALLRLAQSEFESGRFAAATSWARQAIEHPLVSPDQAAHGRFLLGMAALHSSQLDAAREARTALASMDGESALRLTRELDRLLASPPRPNLAEGVTVHDVVTAAGLDRVIGEPIWYQPLDESLRLRWIADAGEGVTASPTFRRDQEEGDFLTSVPTVAGALVYVNQGHRVAAFNRFTERLVWMYPRDTPVAPLDRDITDVGDMNVVVVSDHALVTLTGHAIRDTRAGQGAVLCLDAVTGEFRWSARIDRLGPGEELEGLFPHGAPVIAEGMVFVIARKLSPQQLASTYVVALDLATGERRWAQHIASCGGIQNRLSRPFSTLVVNRGEVFVTTAVGAVACLDAATGLTRWLQRFTTQLATGSLEHAPWEIAAPVLTRRGVMVIQPDERSIALLDRLTGDRLEAHATLGAWGDPRYLLADDERVYAVEREGIRAFAHDRLAEPIWIVDRIPAGEQPPPVEGAKPDPGAGLGNDDPLAVRGRVQLVVGALVVPTQRGIVILDSESGRPVNHLPLAMGNPLAVDQQLLVAGDDRLEAFMPFDAAEAMLRERLAAAPNDADPALALLRLGMRARRPALSLEAARLAWTAMTRGGGAPAEGNRLHHELFDMLLTMHHHELATDDAEAEQVHDVLRSVAVHPPQRLEFQLVRGRWLESRRLMEAVETLQAIFEDDTLAATIRAGVEVRRPGADWAHQALADLISRHGSHAYAAQSARAQAELERLLATGAEPESLMTLAARYPFADAGIRSARDAARLFAQRGDTRRSLASLTALVRVNPAPHIAREVLGSMVEACFTSGWTRQAEALLQFAAASPERAPLVTSAGPCDPGEWLRSLVDREWESRPLMGSAGGAAIGLAGTIVPWHSGARGEAPADRILLASGARVSLITAPDLRVEWTADVHDSGTQILAMDRDHVDLWSASNPGDPHVRRLSAVDGAELWATPRLNDLLPPVFSPAETPSQLPSGEAFTPAETIPLMSESAIYFVRRSGGVLALGTADREKTWSAARTLDQVHEAILHDYGLVLAGGRWLQDQARGLVPTILILDPASGRVLHEFRPRGAAAVRWLATTPLGELAFGTGDGVTLVDMLSGKTLWMNTSEAARDSRRAWAVGDMLITEDRLAGMADLRSLRAWDGVMSGPFDAPIRGGWTPAELLGVLPVSGGVYAHYSDRITRYDLAGQRQGADVVSDKRDYRWLLRGRNAGGEDRLLVVSLAEVGQVPAEDRERRTIYRYRMYLMAGDGRVIGDVLALKDLTGPIRRAVMIDGWLLLSTDESRELPTLAMPWSDRPSANIFSRRGVRGVDFRRRNAPNTPRPTRSASSLAGDPIMPTLTGSLCHRLPASGSAATGGARSLAAILDQGEEAAVRRVSCLALTSCLPLAAALDPDEDEDEDEDDEDDDFWDEDDEDFFDDDDEEDDDEED